MLLSSLPFFFIAILIILLMPGPIFFKQKRIGKRGKPFNLIKFRTMKVASGKSSGSFDAGDSSRITPLGSFLRKTK
ncbi:MAG: sugar transferase, partial [Bacteroidales bacterium]|nr:sugar transferase [Bacteroidales bacterium]